MPRPAIFSDLSFDAALAEAKARGLIVLVDATATWCGPCKIMDSTTWVAPDVVAALADRVLAIQVDIDAQPEVKAKLKVQAVPTIVALRDGEELDRVVGAQAADKLIGWVEGLARGETSLGQARTLAKQRPLDVSARLSLARVLLRAGLLQEATVHYTWIWENMLSLEPTSVGVRHSVLLAEIHELTRQYEPARAAFANLRRAVAPAAEGQPDVKTLADWLSLNNALGDSAASLAWFDSMNGKLVFTDRLAKLLELTLLAHLVREARWADVAALFPKPVATLQRLAEMVRYADRELPTAAAPAVAQQVKADATHRLRQMAGILTRALVAADRKDELVALRAEATKLDPSPQMAAALAG